MASLRKTIQDSIVILVDPSRGEAEERAFVAKFARDSLKGLINGGVFPANYTRYVDNVEGAPEEAVKLDNGKIVYEGITLVEAVVFALAYLTQLTPLGPAKGGHLRDDWFVSVDGTKWTGALQDLPADRPISIVNFRPYAGKLDRRAQLTNSARSATQRRFPTVEVTRTFISIPNGYERTDGQMIVYPALILRPI